MEHLDGMSREIREKRYIRKLDIEIERLQKQNNSLKNINEILDQVIYFGVFATIIHLVYRFF